MRLTARESLQRVCKNQTLKAEDMTKLFQEKALGMVTIFICTQVVQQRRDSIKERYELAKTIPGTQSYRYFETFQDNKHAMKRISNDADFAFIYSYLSLATHINVNLANYIACKYVDETVWIENVRDVNECEVELKFLYSRFPAASY